jgi:phosphoribosylglycinamide formyltransferase-1
MGKKFRIAVLASGRGTNFQAILNNVKSGKLNVKIDVLISDRRAAKALEIAQENNIDTVYFNIKEYPSHDKFDKSIAEELKRREIDLVCLAGYMKIVGQPILEAFKNKIINIHPALLPSFPGLDAQKQAVEYGVRYSGCTVHFVDEGVDSGPIILQQVVTVEQNDTEESLAERILKEEHKLYSKAIDLISKGKVRIEGRKVYIDE